MTIKNYLPALIIPIIFFIVSFFTLSNYGISWDEPIHFQRGQAYLYYFLTGKLTYEDLPIVKDHIPKIEGLNIEKEYVQKQIISQDKGVRRSYFQNESLNAKYFVESDSGHPPLNGILAALFNKILYQKLGVLGDIESHHLFIVVSATLLVAIVSIFAYQTYGLTASVVAALCIALYPLFFSESHFNIKDPPEAAFFGLTIWSFWMSLKKYSWKWLLISAIGFSLALGTKFNIFFLPVILLLYLTARYGKTTARFIRKPNFSKLPLPFFIMLILSPALVIAVFIVTWPYLWQDLFGNTISIFKFYKDIGTGGGYQPGYILPGGFNIYPLYWIVITTPIWMLVLTGIGIFYSIKNIKKHFFAPLLWLLWFFIPIIRISLPGTAVYGGIRQIMEYIPAMALLSGLGAYYLLQMIYGKSKSEAKKIFFARLLILITFLGLLIPIIKYHPNENVYFNALIGGLSGADKRQVPSAGNSFGNAYYQAIDWINKNVEQEAELSLVQGTLTNIPILYVRPDIKLWNGYWSAINREGEYLVELTYQGSQVAYPYAWDYINKFLDPIYEVKVDGVPIAKVWKNDLENTKPELRYDEKPYKGKVDVQKQDDEILVILGEEVMLSHITLTFEKNNNCSLHWADVSLSTDGNQWTDKYEPFLAHQINAKLSLDGETANYYFPGDMARFIKIKTHDGSSCLLNLKRFSATIL